MVRNSLKYVSWKQRKVVATVLKAMHTTKAIELMQAQLRKVISLALERILKRWKRPIKDWAAALNHFSIVFEGRS